MRAAHIAAAAVPAFLAGALIGYVAHPGAETRNIAATPDSVRGNARAHVATGHSEADLNRLRERIRRLEHQLAEAAKSAARADEAAKAAIDAAAASNRVEREDAPFRHGPPSAAQMRERMERIRKDDPQRYAQMTNGMARWRAHRQERLRNQFDLLANADTAHMTRKQKATHDKYQELLARQEELRELMNPNRENVTDEQRDAAFKEMRELSHRIRQLQSEERDTLLAQTANALGLAGEDAAEVVSAIKAVYEATGNDDRGGRPHGPPPGPPPGGR